MVIRLEPELESALNEQARRLGVRPDVLALQVLRERFVGELLIRPQDEWERQLVEAGSDCGVSVPDETLSSDGLYD
jgi:hypothetical protein